MHRLIKPLFIVAVCAAGLGVIFGRVAQLQTELDSVKQAVSEWAKPLEGLVENTRDAIFGYSVVSGYSSTLSSSITSSGTTLPVASTKDKADNEIDFDNNVGTRVYFTLEPGTAKEEIAVCTGKSTNQWTGCTRGLSFQGVSLVASSTLQKAHNAGARVVMSNVHYVYEELVDKDVRSIEYIAGRQVLTSSTPFYIGDGTNTGDKCLYFRNGNATSTQPRICFGVGSSLLYASNDGSSSFNLTPTSTSAISYLRGLISESSVLSVATTTNMHPGLAFLTEGGTQRLRVSTSTGSGGKAISIDVNGLFLNASTTLHSGLTFNTNTGALEVSPFFYNLNASGTLYAENFSVIGASGTSTFPNVTTTNNLVASRILPSATVTTATATIYGNLQVNGSIDATGINYIAPQVVIGTFTKALNAAGNTTSTHNLGVVPKTVEVWCSGPSDSTGAYFNTNGIATSISSEQSVAGVEDGTNGQAVTDSSNIVRAINDVSYGAGSGVGGNLTILNSSIMEITWTITNSISETMQCMYKVSR